jgi:hypothetical protein
MDEQFFDNLAKGLDDGTISRRRALKLVGAAAFGAALMPLFPRQADARVSAKKRCKRKGGLWLSATDPASPCRCATTCANGGTLIPCNSAKTCICMQTVETGGRGFCVGNTANPIPPESGCSVKDDCPAGATCVFISGCGTTGDGIGGTECANGADCETLSREYGCVNGTCQKTFCAFPCTTS